MGFQSRHMAVGHHASHLRLFGYQGLLQLLQVIGYLCLLQSTEGQGEHPGVYSMVQQRLGCFKRSGCPETLEFHIFICPAYTVVWKTSKPLVRPTFIASSDRRSSSSQRDRPVSALLRKKFFVVLQADQLCLIECLGAWSHNRYRALGLQRVGYRQLMQSRLLS